MINDEQAVAMTTISSQALESKRMRYRNEKGGRVWDGAERESWFVSGRPLLSVWVLKLQYFTQPHLTQGSLGNRANEMQTINLPLFH